MVHDSWNYLQCPLLSTWKDIGQTFQEYLFEWAPTPWYACDIHMLDMGSVKYNSLWTFAGRFTPVNYCYNSVARDKNSRDPGNRVYTNRKSHIFFSVLTKSQSKENKETFTWTFYFLWYVLMQTVSQSWLILSTTCMW